MNAAPPGGIPKKRKTPTATKQGAFQTDNTPLNFIAQNTPVQAVVTDSFERFRRVWAACIQPTGRKLVLLALTDYANADGSGIRPTVITLAGRCNISPKQARRHVHDLVALGVLRPTRAAAQHRATTYTLDFAALAALPPMGRLESVSTPTCVPQHSHGCPSALPPMGANPGKDQGKTTPPGGGASSGSGFAGPKEVNSVLWNRWVKKTRPDADDLANLLLRGEELRTEGADLDKLVKQALDNNWRFWPRVGDAVPVRGSRLGASDADWGVPT